MGDKKDNKVRMFWVHCPACKRKDYRWRIRHGAYRCMVCGGLFAVNHQRHELKVVQETLLSP